MAYESRPQRSGDEARRERGRTAIPVEEFREDGSRRAASRRRSRAHRVSGTQAQRDLPDAKASPDQRPIPQCPPWQAHALRRAPVLNDHGLEIVYRRLQGAGCPRPSLTWRLVVTRFRPRPLLQVPFVEELRRSCIGNGPARDTSDATLSATQRDPPTPEYYATSR